MDFEDSRDPFGPRRVIRRRDDEISFLDRSQQYFVSFVDMINSTEIASRRLGPDGMRKYYSLFINGIASLVREAGGKVLKNAGDCLIVYFPQSANTRDHSSLKRSLDCCLDICDAHGAMNTLARREGLPAIDYRVSADYGTVELAKSKTSSEYDLIGPTMNLCSKINNIAKSNSLVIGGDLHEIIMNCTSIKPAHRYRFEQVGEYSAGLKCAYPVYSVTRKMDSAINKEAFSSDSDEHQRYRIMIVDDEPDVLMTLVAMLGPPTRIDVESFTDSLEALRQFLAKNTGYYNLVVADIRMPKLNGIQLTRILKSLDRELRILLVTAHDIVEEVSSMLPEVDRNSIIRKPLSQETFLSKVNLAMAK
jgi:class 3 adenylate cyclase